MLTRKPEHALRLFLCSVAFELCLIHQRRFSGGLRLASAANQTAAEGSGPKVLRFGQFPKQVSIPDHLLQRQMPTPEGNSNSPQVGQDHCGPAGLLERAGIVKIWVGCCGEAVGAAEAHVL
ncbi:MAG: hypothetical protein NTW07_11600, partial [candidate division Zixibacteria bacterium]|nr:hypothetical protein [candidate division Zixibacteria bacterium]